MVLCRQLTDRKTTQRNAAKCSHMRHNSLCKHNTTQSNTANGTHRARQRDRATLKGMRLLCLGQLLLLLFECAVAAVCHSLHAHCSCHCIVSRCCRTCAGVAVHVVSAVWVRGVNDRWVAAGDTLGVSAHCRFQCDSAAPAVLCLVTLLLTPLCDSHSNAVNNTNWMTL